MLDANVKAELPNIHALPSGRVEELGGLVVVEVVGLCRGFGDAYKWKTNNRFSVCTLQKHALGHAGVWLSSNQRS